MKNIIIETIFFCISFVVLAIFLPIAIADWIGERKHSTQTTTQQETVQQAPTYFDEKDPNVFVVEQDGLHFTFYVNEDPNVIDIYVTDADGTHEFKHNGEVVEELRHTFVMEFDKDVDRNFVRRQYPYLIKKYYKTVGFIVK